MAEVADRNVLPDVELKIAASRRQDKSTFDCRRPDKVAVNDALDVLQDGVSVIAGLGERRILTGSEQNRVRPIHTHKA